MRSDDTIGHGARFSCAQLDFPEPAAPTSRFSRPRGASCSSRTRWCIQRGSRMSARSRKYRSAFAERCTARGVCGPSDRICSADSGGAGGRPNTDSSSARARNLSRRSARRAFTPSGMVSSSARCSPCSARRSSTQASRIQVSAGDPLPTRLSGFRQFRISATACSRTSNGTSSAWRTARASLALWRVCGGSLSSPLPGRMVAMPVCARRAAASTEGMGRNQGSDGPGSASRGGGGSPRSASSVPRTTSVSGVPRTVSLHSASSSGNWSASRRKNSAGSSGSSPCSLSVRSLITARREDLLQDAGRDQ